MKCHDSVIAEVRGLIESDAFPVGVSVAGLLRLVEAIAGPFAVRREAVQRARIAGFAGFPPHVAQFNAEKHGNHDPLREAVAEEFGDNLSADAVVAAVALVTPDFSEAQRGHQCTSLTG
jgi:hypothetical protein